MDGDVGAVDLDKFVVERLDTRGERAAGRAGLINRLQHSRSARPVERHIGERSRSPVGPAIAGHLNCKISVDRRSGCIIMGSRCAR